MAKSLPKNASLEEKKKWMLERAVEHGYPHEAAAAMVGNALGENSKLDPGLLQKRNATVTKTRIVNGKKVKYTAKTVVPVTVKGAGRGLFQVGTGARFDNPKETNLVGFAEKRGKPWDDFETQVDFMLHELDTVPRFKGTKEKLMKAKSVPEATDLFLREFEGAKSTQKDASGKLIDSEAFNKAIKTRTDHALSLEKYRGEQRGAKTLGIKSKVPAIDMTEAEDIEPALKSEIPAIPNLPISAPGTGIDAPTVTPEPEPEPELKSEIPSIDMGEPELKSEIPSIDMTQGDDVAPETQVAPQEPTNPGSPLVAEDDEPLPVTAQANPKALARQEREQARGVYDTDEFHTPFKIDEVPNDFFDHGVFDRPVVTGPDTVSAQSLVGRYREKPGAFAQVAHAFKEANSLVVAGELAIDHIGQKNPHDDPAPENWTAMNPEAVKDFPQKYWPYITSAQSPNDQEARRQALRARIQEDEKYESGSLTWKLLGGLAGGITDPINYLIPMASGYKGARMLTGVMMDAKKAFPAIAIPSLAHEALVQTQKAGGNLEDMATNAFTDTVFGMSLVGALGAGKYAKQALDLYKTRAAFNLAADGVKVDFVHDENGNLTGEVRATSADGKILCA